jgi:hypothetical protein
VRCLGSFKITARRRGGGGRFTVKTPRLHRGMTTTTPQIHGENLVFLRKNMVRARWIHGEIMVRAR